MNKQQLKQIGANFLQAPEEKLRALGDFVQFVSGLSLKQFEATRAKYIWELVPKQLAGRSIARGTAARELYQRQWPADLFYSAHEHQMAHAEIAQIPLLPDGHRLDIFSYPCGDYSIAHKNFKWALIRNHEEGQLPIEPIFIFRS